MGTEHCVTKTHRIWL